MNSTDRLIIFGLLAVIAWELYPGDAAAQSADCQQALNSSQVGPTTASPWIQQLSRHVFGQDKFTPQCGVFGSCR